MTDGTVKIGAELDDSGVKKGLNNLGSIAKSGFSVLGGAATTFAKTSVAAIGAVTGGMAAAGTAAIAVGKEFETSFAKASTLFGDVSVDTDNLKKNLLAVSDATGVTATELNESLYSALSAGIPVTEDMGEATAFLESSAKLAKAGFTDMDTALSATAKTLNAYGMDVSEADRINKILIQTQNKGITTVGELGASLAQVTPTAAAFGVSFENVGAALANMTAAGTPTAQATTQLNSLIAELGKSGTVGAKSLEKAAKGTQYAGKSFNELMNDGVPLNEVLDLIRKSADKSGLSMVDMFSSIEAGKAALALSGENSEKFASNLEAMGTSADVVTEAYDKVSDTLENKVAKITNSAKNLGIQIYNGIQEPLKGVADVGLGYLEELAEAFSTGGVTGLVDTGADIVSDIAVGITEQLPSLIDQAVAFIDTFVQALTDNMPQLLAAGGQILMALFNGIVSLIPSIAGLGWSIISGIVESLSANSGQIEQQGKHLLSNLLNAIRTELPKLAQAGFEMIGNLAEGLLDNLPQVLSSAGDICAQLLDALLDALPQLLESGITFIANLAKGIVSNLPSIIGAINTIIVKLLGTLASHLPEILEKGIELIAKLAVGIIEGIPKAVESIPKVIKGIGDAFLEFDWAGIGINILKGIANGLKGAVKTVKDAASDVAESAYKSAKEFLGIHSPSRLFRDEIGKNISLGIAEGITKNKKYAKKSSEDVAEAVLQAAKKKLDNESVYRELSLADEVAYWDSVRKQIKAGTQARIDADKEYYQAKKSLNSKMASAEESYSQKVQKTYDDLEKSVKSLRDSYADALTSRTKDIMGSMNLFSEFEAKTELTTGDLLKNLQSQVDGLRDWSSNLADLQHRGVSGDMLDELRDMGTDAAGEIALLTQMSDEELNEYISLWKQKQRIARREAKKELAPMLEETEQQIAQMRINAAAELEQYKAEFVSAMAEIGVEIQKPLGQIQTELLKTLSTAVQAAAGTVSAESSAQGNVNQFGELASSVINSAASLPTDFVKLGQDTVSGMIQGLQDKTGDLCAAMASIIQQAVQTAKNEAQIHSPSRLMRDMIGRNMIAGIGVGFDLETDNLNRDARSVIKDTADTMRKTSAKEFISSMQMQPIQAAAGVDSSDNYLIRSNSEAAGDIIDYGRMGKEMKKAINGTSVEIDGQKAGAILSPHVDSEFGYDEERKGRGN